MSLNLSDIVTQCMHCGLCLPACPTYQLTKKETSSPRGRIRLVKGVTQGEIPVSRQFDYEMNFCLGCHACMSACPAGVQCDEILETGRALAPPHWILQKLLRFFFAKKSRLRLLSVLTKPFLGRGIRQRFPAVIPAIGP